jgi:hypothetical protein
MVPLDLGRAETYEDPAVRTLADRERLFWQSDHMRLYAPDIGARLAQAGFVVESEAPASEDLPRFGLLESDLVWLCRRPGVVKAPDRASP